MAYIADATNVATPADSDQARYAAAELRAIKARIIAAEAEAVAVADAAQADADTAQAAAAAAQSTADGAVTDAATAQGTADTALANAATAQGTADAALAAAALAAAGGMKSASLSGSGMWTVPSGVTQVIAFLQGGGSADVKFTGSESSPYASIAFRQLGEAGASRVAYLSVTEGQELAYSVGLGQVLSNPPVAFVGGLNLETQPPTPSYIAGYSAAPARPRNAMLYPSSFPSENTWYIAQSPRLDGKLGTLTSPAGTVYILDTVGHNTAGEAGSITLLYR